MESSSATIRDIIDDPSTSSQSSNPETTNETNNEESSTEYRSSTQYSFTPTSSEKTSTKPKPDLSDDGEEKRDETMFECNICLDSAKDAVVSMCGHLFCWPCLNTWLETRPTRQLCPVCKAGISKDKVIPLYGRNSDKTDPRTKTPRPQAQRAEPENTGHGFQAFGFGDGGFHLSFGIGAFPFGFFASSFNFHDILHARGAQQPGTPQYEEDQFLSKVFLWVAIMFFTWLAFA